MVPPLACALNVSLRKWTVYFIYSETNLRPWQLTSELDKCADLPCGKARIDDRYWCTDRELTPAKLQKTLLKILDNTCTKSKCFEEKCYWSDRCYNHKCADLKYVNKRNSGSTSCQDHMCIEDGCSLPQSDISDRCIYHKCKEDNCKYIACVPGGYGLKNRTCAILAEDLG